MAKPVPGEKCPGCGGEMRGERVPRDDRNPRGGMRWFRACVGSAPLQPIQKLVPGRGLVVTSYRRVTPTCTWQDPDLLEFRARQRERSIKRAEQRAAARQRRREAEARRAAEGEGP